MAVDQKTKALVCHLSRIKGLSIRPVARECNVSWATVWRISKMDMSSRWKKTDRETRGRPKKTKCAPGKKTTTIDLDPGKAGG